MRVDVVTLFPGLVESLAEYGIPRRAAEQGLLELHSWNPRDYTHDRHRTVDDRPYGGGPGMLMKVQPVRDAIREAKVASPAARVVYLSPQGQTLDQAKVCELAEQPGLILLAGRYEGVDERLVERYVDEEISIGDYVLSGGEPAAMVLIDAVTRMLPGALGHRDSAQQDSFMEGLLDCPHYTRPEEIDGLEVPEVLKSGDHARIDRWRLKQALGRTYLRRPDLLAKIELDETQRQLLQEFLEERQAGPNQDSL